MMRNDRIPELKEGLASIVGFSNVLTTERETKSYRNGFRLGSGLACAVVIPNSLIQLWKIVNLCISLDKIIIIQAANTGLTGGSTPNGNDYDRDVVVVNTLGLDQLILLNGGNQVLAFPGATLFKLEELLTPLNKEPHSVIGSSCIGASIVGGVCNNSGGNLLNRGPSYTELSLYARVNHNGELELVNHLGIELGDTPEQILVNLENQNFEKEGLPLTDRNASDSGYKQKIRDFESSTPARFNADKRCLFESSGCAGKIVVFAVRLDTFPKPKEKKVFYIGTNKPEYFNNIRKNILSNFVRLPEMTEYIHSSAFDGADQYGKDTFLFIKYFGKNFIPYLFQTKRKINLFLDPINFIPSNFLDILLYHLSTLLPDHLPSIFRIYRRKFEHYLLLVITDESILDTRLLLNDFVSVNNDIEYIECDKKQGDDILLHRFVAGISPSRFKILNSSSSGELLPLDVALPRNYDLWYEIVNDKFLSKSLKSFQMGHFMCMVFHWDFILEKGTNHDLAKNNILEWLKSIGAKYPAEHNVGHFYKAEEDLASFYRELDPINSFNPGIGKQSKNKYYK